MNLEDKVSILKGIGPKKAIALEKLNINCLADLMYFFPRRYEDRRQIIPIYEAISGNDVLIAGTVISKFYDGNSYKKNKPLRLIIEDKSGIIDIIFFNANYISNYFELGTEYRFFGRINENFNEKQMIHPEFHKLGEEDDIRGIIPIYPITEGITQKDMRKWQKNVSLLYSDIKEWLPNEIVDKNNLCSLGYAFENIHFPKETRQVLESKFRFIFEEFLIFQTGLLYIKNGENNIKNGIKINILNKTNRKDTNYSNEVVQEFIENLPFELTSGQKKVWREVQSDLYSKKPMNRLIQGDVGSGKTVIAEMAMFVTVKAGYQGVMMVPTELLAKQHLDSLIKDFGKFKIKIGLLCSSMKTAAKIQILEKLKSGEIQVLIGTSAVIQEVVEFKNLGLVVTDEQHRFGVKQRSLLSKKGEDPNIMVMTATPIPRTMAVIIYGNLDISIIDTMPIGRKPIKTVAQNGKNRNEIYDFVKNSIKMNKQAYVVAPLIEDSEKIDAKSAEELYKELIPKFEGYRVAIIHGGMKQNEKDGTMAEFVKGKIDVLISTVVIEVGINVKNATIMVIESCERFGLAQLHQLRGRVGRGDEQSYCFLICYNESKIAVERNKIIVNSTDGFEIAEEDLRLRGPGEFFGTKQHGLPELRIGDLIRHAEILEKTRVVAKKILENDLNLTKEENIILKIKVKKMFGDDIKLEL